MENGPEKRIEVFISSAQRDENGFKWGEVRKNIKKKLNECKYFNTFLIEDNSSYMKSTQLMQFEVRRTDVVVQIIKGEYRSGTSDEFAFAIQYGKPLLVIFLDEILSPEVSSFKKKIQKIDACTYCTCKDVDTLPDFIKDKLITDIIRTYQQIPLLNEKEENYILEIANELNDEVVRKTTISLFSGCYSYLLNLLDIKYLLNTKENTNSEFYDLGKKLLLWLVDGKVDIKEDELIIFIERIAEVYNNKELLIKRWKAISLKYSGDYPNAFLQEKEALEIARKDKKARWIINDILVDCRNLEGMIYNNSKKWIDDMASQSELASSDTIVYVPISDRYAKNIYEYIYRDEFNIDSLSPDTISIGNDFQRALSDVTNYFFTAVIYGSDTHIVLSRDLLIKVLYKYGNLTNDAQLLYLCVRINILNGNVKDLKRLVDSRWYDLYPILSVKADDLYKLAFDGTLSNRDTVVIAIVEKVGMYLSDDVFSSVESFYQEYARRLERNKTEEFLKSLKTIMRRFNQEYVIDIMIGIIEKDNYITAYRISDVLSNIDYDNVSNEKKCVLKDTLLDKWANLVKNNADPQLIAVLNMNDKAVFECLEKLPNNGLDGIEKCIYDINVGNTKDWLDILIYEIDTAKKQFESNNNLFGHIGYAINPYNMISQIIKKPSVDDEIINVIVERFIPLTEDIMGSNVDVQTKNNCVSCLCDVLIAMKKWDILIPESVITAINKLDINSGAEFLSTQNRKVLSIRTLMCKIIVGEAGIDDLLLWCYEYEAMNRSERLALVNCIEKYISGESSSLESNRLLVSIVFRCVADKDDSIRCVASKCLAYFSKELDLYQIEDMLIKLSFDPSHNVRHVLYLLCRDNMINPPIMEKILENLNNDLNYVIRKESLELHG